MLKDAVEAWLSRIRNPISGSILLVFFVFNWKPIWYLLFAEKDVAVKFHFFDMNTSFHTLVSWPIALGFLLAALMPWVKFFGVWISVSPVRYLRQLYVNERYLEKVYEISKETELEIAKTKAEEARERRLIERAERIKEAREIGDSDVVEDIILDRQQEDGKNRSPAEIYGQLSKREVAVLSVLGELGHSVDTSHDSDRIYFISSLSGVIDNLSDIRIKVELDGSLALLAKEGLTQKSAYGGWTLTELGYKVFDVLKPSELDERAP